MRNKSFITMLITGGLIASSSAFADHNSIWGAGHANMPNDIHNTRIEDDNETFRDLVQQGGGADSVNRYADDSTTTVGNRSYMSSTDTGSRARTSMTSRTAAMSRGGRR